MVQKMLIQMMQSVHQENAQLPIYVGLKGHWVQIQLDLMHL